MDKKVIWMDIEGYTDYMVSNTGEVYSKNYGRLSQCEDVNGYLVVCLSKNGKGKVFKVHRLVAQAFVEGRTESKNVINHKDENKKNNNASNLEWCTQKHNIMYGTRTQRMRETVINNNRGCIPVSQYNLKGECIATYKSIKDAHEQTGYPCAYISACCKGEKHSAHLYTFKYSTKKED